MNIRRILRTSKYFGESIRNSRIAVAVAVATLTWSLSVSVAHGQQPRTLQHEGHSFEVVPASEMASVFEVSEGESVVSEFDRNFPLVHGSHVASGQYGAGACASGSCGGTAVGAGGLYLRGLFGHRGNRCNGPCSDCQPFWYGRVEAVYMHHNELDNFTRSRTPEFRLDDPDWETAPRITIGTAPDCVSGWEASFVGPLNFDISRTVMGAGGQTLLGDTDPTTGGIFRLFDDPTSASPNTRQYQRYQSDYWSVEASKTSLAWDIAKLLFGPRYIRFDERYDYAGVSNDSVSIHSGSIDTRARNNLIGLQVGADIFTPVSRSTSAYFRGRAGGYYNHAESNARVDNFVHPIGGGPVVKLNRYGIRDEHDGFAAMFEIGGGLQCQISRMFSIHGGGELWYLTQVATAADQIPSRVGVGAPTRATQASDDVFFAGFNIGATMKY